MTDAGLSYVNKGVSSDLATGTPFHQFAHQYLASLPLIGKFRLRDAIDHSLCREAVLTQADIMLRNGTPLSEGIIRAKNSNLLQLYLLCSSVCITPIRSKQFVLITKSREVLISLCSRLVPTLRHQGIASFIDFIKPSYEEVEEGKFRVVRIEFTAAGYMLSKVSLPQRSTTEPFLPYHLFNVFAKRLVLLLQNQRVELTYLEGGKKNQLRTTLQLPTLCKYLGVESEEGKRIFRSDWLNPKSLGYLSLPDLEHSNEFIPVPFPKIIAIAESQL